MTTLFVSQLDPNDSSGSSKNFEIVIEAFASAMREYWQLSKISISNKESKYALEWEIENETQTNMQGRLHSDLLTVSFSRAPIDDVADFIYWYRSYVPKHQPLYLFDEGLSLVVLLRDTFTHQDMIDLIS